MNNSSKWICFDRCGEVEQKAEHAGGEQTPDIILSEDVFK